MTDGEAKALMEHHGITVAQREAYHYQGFVYGSLLDAVNYAELVTERADKLAARRAERR